MGLICLCLRTLITLLSARPAGGVGRVSGMLLAPGPIDGAECTDVPQRHTANWNWAISSFFEQKK